jgi:hypothetical protein
MDPIPTASKKLDVGLPEDKTNRLLFRFDLSQKWN